MPARAGRQVLRAGRAQDYSRWRARGGRPTTEIEFALGALALERAGRPRQACANVGPKTTTPAGGGGPAGVVFVDGLREEEKTGLSVIAGEEVGFDEIPFACFRRGETFLGNNARRGRRCGGRRFGGQRSGGGEGWPYPSGSGRRSTLAKFLRSTCGRRRGCRLGQCRDR
jgi:hypothetical protein